MQLSKSDYLLFLKHPCWLWLKKHDKSKLPEVDANTQKVFDNGFLFESYAEQLFPGAVKIGWDGYQEYLSMPARTLQAILAGAKVIFQGRWEHNLLTGDEVDKFYMDNMDFKSTTCICDVVEFINEKTVNLYEVKSSTAPRTLHYYDLAFQKQVLESEGHKVEKCFVIHVNNQFVRKGEVDPKELCVVADVTAKVNKLAGAVKGDIERAFEVIASKEMPNPTPSFCKHGCTKEWLDIYKNLMGIKDGDGSIYDLYSPSAELILALEDAGIRNMLDVPNDFDLGKKREWQLKAAKEDKLCIDEQKIKKFLSEIKYPIYFLDYETMMSVVPYFEGHKPYQQVPFQYSLHILEKPGSELKHVEYLHKENSCPVKQLSESLKENIGTEGSVIVWNQAFEMGCNEDMAVMHPEFKEFYKNVNSRVVDLMVPFFNFWYVDKRFGGSASIKSVLPVLCPDLSYKDLDIPEGAAAQRLWMEAVLDGKRDGEKEKILKDLWDYCGLDTLAMVRIWEFLENLFEKEPVKPLQQTLL